MAKKSSNGKSPKGRAASKQKAKRGPSGAASSPFASHFVRSSGWGREGDDDDDGNDRAFLGFKGFTQTKHSHNTFSPRSSSSNPISTVRLRHQAISFVSASPLSQRHREVEETQELEVLGVDSEEFEEENEEDLDDAVAEIASMKLHIGGEIAEDDSEMELDEPDSPTGQQLAAAPRRPFESLPFARPQPELPFFVDTVGDATLARLFQAPSHPKSGERFPSPARSESSSDELLLFRGRGPVVVNDPAVGSRPLPHGSSHGITPSTGSAPTHPQPSGGDDMARGWAAVPGAWEKDVNPNATWAPAPAGSWWRKGKPRPDLNPSDADTKTLENAPARQSKIRFALPGPGAASAIVAPGVDQLDGAENSHTPDKVPQKKIARLADMFLAQAQDNALSPDKKAKKNYALTMKGEAITKLQAELEPEYSQEALKLAEIQAAHIQQVNLERAERKKSQLGGNASCPSGGGDEQTIDALRAECKTVLRTKKQGKQTATSKPTRRNKRGKKHDPTRALRDIMSDGEDEDEVGEAAYDDYMANLAAQDSENNSEEKAPYTFSAPDGGPSLFVKGKEVADDELLNHDEPLEMDYATAMNGDDSTSDSDGPLGEDLDEISDMDSSELEQNLEYTEQEQWEDEEDLRRRRQERMTDEQIARIFAKQEELGIYGDEMVLDDGDFGDSTDNMDGIGDVDAARAGLAKYSQRPTKKRGRSDHFPNASAFADTLDQYGADGFDIMDFDRPSLRNTKGGRKGRPPPELEALSDEELKADMMDAWDNDRNKKRLKKAEREELRMQGLLGAAGKKGKADLNQKYATGITMQQIHEELRVFLQDPTQQARTFPAMAKNDRKTLHELVIPLGLQSKSVGTGMNRKPVVYKTAHTRVFDNVTFLSAISRSNRGLLDRDGKLGRKKKTGGKYPKTTRDTAGGVAAATIRNGEVVGAGAAQIGTESKGYKLLAKMGGWKAGMALGKEGEGRLEPVEQVMRAGRSGLGDR